jgi:tripartite-type tricarboxylate transporter receptor subunit TctC
MNKCLALVFAVLVAAIAAPALAQNFPDRPIRVIVPYPPGGPTDTVARVATKGLDAAIGQALIIENVAGAGGRIGARDVARATPDGYTLLLGGTNDNAITPALYKNLDYDPVAGFLPVAALATDSEALVTNPTLPAHTLTELVRYAKEHPGKLSSGAAIGIAPHLLLQFIRARSGVDIVFVPYKGSAPAIADLLGNQIQLTVTTKSVLLPLIAAGKLRALAVTATERWPELPDVPTLRESGFDGFPAAIWFGLLAPAGTPPDVIAKLNAAVNARLISADMQAAIARIGLQARPLSVPAFKTVLGDEVRLWETVRREAGVSLEEPEAPAK